jgi:hypothetical protein
MQTSFLTSICDRDWNVHTTSSSCIGFSKLFGIDLQDSLGGNSRTVMIGESQMSHSKPTYASSCYELQVLEVTGILQQIYHGLSQFQVTPGGSCSLCKSSRLKRGGDAEHAEVCQSGQEHSE